MKRTLLALLIFCSPIFAQEPVGRVQVDLLAFSNPHGTVGAMAIRWNGEPAVGRTTVLLITPCGQTTVFDDFVDFSAVSDPVDPFDLALFNFTLPLQCPGRYFVSVIVLDASGEILAGYTAWKVR